MQLYEKLVAFDSLISGHWLLDLLGVHHLTPVIEMAGRIVMIQLWLLLFLICYVIWTRSIHIWSRRNNFQRTLEYKRIISEYAKPENFNMRGETIRRLRMKFNIYSELGFFRRLLLEQLALTKGQERENLVEMYHQLNLIRVDLKELESILWWKRLRAMDRMDKLKDVRLASYFQRYFDDPNDFVAISAMRGFSRLPIPNKTQTIMSILRKRKIFRKDVVCDLLANIAQGHVTEVIDFLENCNDSEIQAIFIKVLGEMRAKESVNLLMEFTGTSDENVIAETAKSLGVIGDPRALPNLQSLSDHPSALVRSQAIAALLRLGDKSILDKLDIWKNDPDIQIRRAVFETTEDDVA